MQVIFSFTLAMASADTRVVLREPVPIVYFSNTPTRRLRVRPLRRRYSRNWD